MLATPRDPRADALPDGRIDQKLNFTPKRMTRGFS
jgi:hypothetical protein